MHQFIYQGKELYCEGVPIRKIADDVGHMEELAYLEHACLRTRYGCLIEL